MQLTTYKHFTGQGPQGNQRTYVIPPEKAKIVDFAIQLGRPLLVEGEAGCGKTRLADAIASELGLDLPIIIPVRSTSRANDLLYRFDALRRLQDSQIPEKRSDATWAHRYVHLEPLGRAIFEGRPCVILVDEIDKGDVDFPNDLLHVLDRFEFVIDEIPENESQQAIKDNGFGQYVTNTTGVKPIVVFTSNREKQLPKPFLRRCLYLELTFPSDPKDLAEIVEINLMKAHLDTGVKRERAFIENVSRQLIDKAVQSFLEIRAAAEQNSAHKKPATAELIDWIHVLHWNRDREDEIQGAQPPYWQILFSSSIDIETHANRTESAGSRKVD
jgi:MoxR-like ATPase